MTETKTPNKQETKTDGKPETKKIEVMEVPLNKKAPTISITKDKDIVIITIPNTLHPTFARGFCAEIEIFVMNWFQKITIDREKIKEDAARFSLKNGIKNIKKWGQS